MMRKLVCTKVGLGTSRMTATLQIILYILRRKFHDMNNFSISNIKRMIPSDCRIEKRTHSLCAQIFFLEYLLILVFVMFAIVR